MARTQARLASSIWGDQDWTNLSVHAQHAYFMLLTQPKLTLAGCLDWMPQRWDKLAQNPDSAAAIEELIDARFVVAHDDELVIRTFVRNDLCAGTLNRNLIKGMWAAWSAIASPLLRKVVIDNMPEKVWVMEGVEAPDQAKELRSEPRLELPLEPRSEPSVDCYLLPADGYLLPHPGSISGQPQAQQPEPTPDDDDVEQKLREAASRVGRAMAETRPGVDDPRAYGRTIAAEILTGSDPTDRDRIRTSLALGETPTQIAESWTVPTTARPAAPAADPAAIEAARQAAARREQATRERLATQAAAEVGDHRSGAALARAHLRPVPDEETA